MPLHFIRTFSVPSSARYRFLDYARYHWTTHTKHVEIGGQLWDKFTRLALTSNETWKLHPWTTGDRSQLSQLRAMFGWAVKEHHLPLFRLALQFESWYISSSGKGLIQIQHSLHTSHLMAIVLAQFLHGLLGRDM